MSIYIELLRNGEGQESKSMSQQRTDFFWQEALVVSEHFGQKPPGSAALLFASLANRVHAFSPQVDLASAPDARHLACID